MRRRLHIIETLSDVRGQLIWTTTKNHQSRDVALPGFVVEKLARHLELYVPAGPDTLVFTTESGTPLRSPNFGRTVWLPATRSVGLEGLRPHDLRHTSAALLISEGAHPRQVMEQLGHSSIATTMNVYGKVFPNDMDAITDRLEERHRNMNQA